ncbi:MAG: phosphoribosylanthranilate isomerase [Thermoleophilia bacterium]|nr:phosphoribosylanthranilate isomerase [Thermoleophilia bacterium]
MSSPAGTVRIQVKLCGLRTVCDVAGALLAGGDQLGIVLVPGARRFAAVSWARHLADVARSGAAEAERFPPLVVGVVGRTPPQDVPALVAAIGVDAVQLTGDEAYAVAVAEALGGELPLVRAIGVPDAADAATIAELAATAARWEARGAGVLFDAIVPGCGDGGGTGARIQADLLAELFASGARGLAGGLDPGNVADAIRAVRPAFVDVSSGIEDALGVKDPERMRAFVAAAHAAQLTHPPEGIA